MSRFWWCWRDAVLGVSSVVWLATQTRHNDAMRPPVPSKNGILAVSASLTCGRPFAIALHQKSRAKSVSTEISDSEPRHWSKRNTNTGAPYQPFWPVRSAIAGVSAGESFQPPLQARCSSHPWSGRIPRKGLRDTRPRPKSVPQGATRFDGHLGDFC